MTKGTSEIIQNKKKRYVRRYRKADRIPDARTIRRMLKSELNKATETRFVYLHDYSTTACETPVYDTSLLSLPQGIEGNQRVGQTIYADYVDVNHRFHNPEETPVEIRHLLLWFGGNDVFPEPFADGEIFTAPNTQEVYSMTTLKDMPWKMVFPCDGKVCQVVSDKSLILGSNSAGDRPCAASLQFRQPLRRKITYLADGSGSGSQNLLLVEILLAYNYGGGVQSAYNFDWIQTLTIAYKD